jgi:hypothetical protein
MVIGGLIAALLLWLLSISFLVSTIYPGIVYNELNSKKQNNNQGDNNNNNQKEPWYKFEISKKLHEEARFKYFIIVTASAISLIIRIIFIISYLIFILPYLVVRLIIYSVICIMSALTKISLPSLDKIKRVKGTFVDRIKEIFKIIKELVLLEAIVYLFISLILLIIFDPYCFFDFFFLSLFASILLGLLSLSIREIIVIWSLEQSNHSKEPDSKIFYGILAFLLIPITIYTTTNTEIITDVIEKAGYGRTVSFLYIKNNKEAEPYIAMIDELTQNKPNGQTSISQSSKKTENYYKTPIPVCIQLSLKDYIFLSEAEDCKSNEKPKKVIAIPTSIILEYENDKQDEKNKSTNSTSTQPPQTKCIYEILYDKISPRPCNLLTNSSK